MENKNLFTIGEVAEAIGITRKIILNYEAKGLINPDKKDGAMGNRYYTIDTVTQIRIIRVFQNLGLSLDEVREYFFGSSDLKPIVKRLENMRDELNLTIEKLKERTKKSVGIVKEIFIEAQTVYCRTYNTDSLAERTQLLRETTLEAVKKYGTDTTRHMFYTETSADNLTQMSCCVAVPKESEGEYIKNVPGSKAISVFHHGAYENIPEARKLLVEYAAENNIKLTGVFRNLFFEGPPQHKDKSRFITQIIALIQ